MTISIWACGGGGINVVGSIPRADEDAQYAQAARYYLDTSDRNLKKNGLSSTDDNVFLLPNANGSGGKMSENKEAIADSIGKILAKYPRSDLNIIVSSACGGSGSPYALYLAKEFLERDEAVVVILIGSFESDQRIKNTLASVRSLNGICRATNKPLAFIYRQNDKPDDKVVNNAIHEDIHSLRVLYSNRLGVIDSKDLYHWNRFEKVCDTDAFAPMPYLLGIYAGNNPAMFTNIKEPISVASVYNAGVEPEQLNFDIIPSYTTHGILQDSTASVDSLHYVISRDALDEIVEGMLTVRERATKQIAARHKKTTLDLGGVDKDGMGF
jgi:hypothetical protein